MEQIITSEELRTLIHKALREGLSSLAFWYSIIIFTITVLGAAIGVWLGSYMKEKGKNLATKEDFTELLQQVKQTTHATEEIKGQYAQIIARMQVNATVLSGNRQQWINTLRDQLAELLSIMAVMLMYPHLPHVDIQDVMEKMTKAFFIEAKICLLLNPKETDHADLLGLINKATGKMFSLRKNNLDLTVVGEVQTLLNQIVPVSQGILKREWERVKAGE